MPVEKDILLQETIELYQTLVDLSPDAIMVYSNGQYVFANPAAVEILGAGSTKDIVGKKILEFVHPDYHQLVTQRVEKIYQGSSVPPEELKLVRIDGNVIDAETRGAMVKFAGKPAAQVVIRDITERKQVEKKINQQNMILKAISRVYEEESHCESVKNLGKVCLDVLESITDSKLSFISEFDAAGLNHVIAIRDSQLQPDINLNPQAFLEVPFIRDGRTVGIIGVGKREGGYRNEDRELLEALTPTVFQVIMRKRTEVALKESEARFNAFMDSNPAVAWIKDESGRQVYMNRTWEKEYGLKKEDYLGTSKFVDQLPGEIAEKLREVDREVLRTGKPVRDIETIGIGAKDGIRYWQTIKFPLQSASGELFTGGMAIDITNQKQTEEALRESEGRFRSVLENSLDGAYRRDLRTNKYDYLSPVIESITGYTVGEMNALTFDIVLSQIHPEDRDVVKKNFEAGLKTGKVRLEYRCKCKNGQYRWLGDYATIIIDEDGCPIYLSGIFRDITQRKRAEELLREREEQYRDIVDLSPDMIVIHQDYKVRYINRAGIKLLGACSANEILGKMVWDFIHPDYCEKVRIRIKGIYEDGLTVYRVEQKYLRVDGSVVDVEVIASRIIYYGKPASEAIIRDITERKDIEKTLRESEERYRMIAGELNEINCRKDDFLAILSHELRNPLGAISNSLFILDHVRQNGQQEKRAIEIMNRQIGHLTRLVDDLLDVTRINQNKIRLQRRQLELNEVVRRTMEDHRLLFEKNGISVEGVFYPDPVFVKADEERLAQVIGNLLLNAAKFTNCGGSTRVFVEKNVLQQKAIIRVVDNGIGMETEMVSRLFQPFMQADISLNRSNGGLGLGLALSKGIIELHGGEIKAYSDGLGKGSEFEVRFPLDSTLSDKPQPVSQDIEHHPRRVLIIDDNPDLTESLRELLQLTDHEAAVSNSGPEGLVKAREFQPEIVLCDIGLPGMDGYAIARAFRADEMFKNVYLVALTGYAQPGDIQKAIEAGFDQHMAKPVNLDTLVLILEKKLQITKGLN